MNRPLKINIAMMSLSFAIIAFLSTSCEDLLSGLLEQRSRLVDDWRVDESATGNKSTNEIYWVAITEHPEDSTKVLISNFYNVGNGAMAEAALSGRNLTLHSQTLPGGFTVSGSGEIQSDWNEIVWSYSVDDGSGIADYFSATFNRME
jgi:hypothetical protein